MPFSTYILRCSDGLYYTGHTEDLDVRLAQHRRGYFKTCWTCKRRPVALAWSETFPTRDEALTAERMVGGWSRAKKEALIAGDWSLLSFFARPPHERVSTSNDFSTSLETNGTGGAKIGDRMRGTPNPFASSEVEKPTKNAKQGRKT